MKILKTLTIFAGLTAFGSFGQMPTEDLPSASINSDYYVTLDPASPLSSYYKVDISHLSFENAEAAKKTLGFYVTGNLITNEVHFAENYMIIQIHTEYLPEDTNLEDVQDYLGHLTKPE